MFEIRTLSDTAVRSGARRITTADKYRVDPDPGAMAPELRNSDIPVEDRHDDVAKAADADDPAIERRNLMQGGVTADRRVEKESDGFLGSRCAQTERGQEQTRAECEGKCRRYGAPGTLWFSAGVSLAHRMNSPS